MIVGLIPAGGKSSRMGRPKLALPVGGQPVLKRVIESLREGGVHHILTVIGPHVPELVSIAEGAGAEALVLAEETPDMRATIEQGLRWLEDHLHLRPEDAWLLVPGDHPTLNAGVVQQVIRAWHDNSQGGIVIPTFQGKRGHPTLIEWRHVAAIRSLTPGLGLNTYFREHTAETLELPVASADVLCDLDTPEDYQRLLAAWNRNSSQ